jgi:hypothetical protein
VGCKIEWTENSLKFTQPVLIQSYSDKIELLTRIYKTTAHVGSVLVVGKKVEALSPVMQKKYCSGTKKGMHTMQYSKAEMYNAVQVLSQHMHEDTKDHYKAMLRVLKYSVDSQSRSGAQDQQKIGWQPKSQVCDKWALGLGLCQGA